MLAAPCAAHTHTHRCCAGRAVAVAVRERCQPIAARVGLHSGACAVGHLVQHHAPSVVALACAAQRRHLVCGATRCAIVVEQPGLVGPPRGGHEPASCHRAFPSHGRCGRAHHLFAARRAAGLKFRVFAAFMPRSIPLAACHHLSRRREWRHCRPEDVRPARGRRGSGTMKFGAARRGAMPSAF